MSKYPTKESILERSKQAIGKRLGDIDSTGRLATGKGAIGNVIEESWFDLKVNNRAEADFVDAGVELKVTPFRKSKNKYTAKERLVMNVINYMTEYSNTFYSSSFWKKNQRLQFMFYEHVDTLRKSEWTITAALLYEYPEADLVIIKNDWEKIVGMIREGRAHELSEGMTQYLGACTKGATAASSLRKQPFSDVLAKQRAYSLKQSYMTYLLNAYVFGKKTNEKIIKSADVLLGNSFESWVESCFKPYLGRTQASLVNEFDLKMSKSVNYTIASRIMGYKGDLNKSEEFIKANMKVKTIRISKNGKSIKEQMSFPSFKFLEIVDEKWETSTLRDMFDSMRYLFVIFNFNETNELTLKGVQFWSIPQSDLDTEVKAVWEKTVETIRQGVVLEYTNDCIYNNLPKQSENPVSHIRPHGRDSKDTYPLPDGREMTKQSFWLNSAYIFNQIKDSI